MKAEEVQKVFKAALEGEMIQEFCQYGDGHDEYEDMSESQLRAFAFNFVDRVYRVKPEKKNLEGFLILNSIGHWGYFYNKDRMRDEATVIIDLSKHNIEYETGEGLEEQSNG